MVNIFSLYPAISCCGGALLTLFIAFLVSFNRPAISYRHTLTILITQIIMALGLLKTSFGQILLSQLIRLTNAISDAAQAGISFIFGALGTSIAPWGFIFAFHVLPIIIFFSAFIAALSYLGIIEGITRLIAFFVRPLFGASQSETACAVAKSFLGPTEAQLLIRDALFTASTSEMFAIMVSGLSMISASLFAIYMGMGIPGSHLIAANVMGISGSLLFAKIIMPTTTQTEEPSRVGVPLQERPANLIEAIIKGTLDGLQLVLAIAALLVSFLALLAILNQAFIFVGSFFGMTTVTFQDVISYIFAPFGFLMGVSTTEAFALSELIGIKFLANEMVAFAEVASKNLSDRGLILATYALCGFSNIACLGIVVGSISTLVPERRSELSGLAWYALLAATLSNLFSAYLVGIII